MKTYLLNWQGPFRYGRRNHSEPEKVPGLYIWVIKTKQKRKVSYVGMASSLSDRFYSHMIYSLGGGYWIYNKGGLSTEKPVDDNYLYRPDPGNWNIDFFKNHAEYSQRALEDLKKYEILWADFDGNTGERKIVESAIINHVWNEYGRESVQNMRLSKYPESDIKVKSKFPKDIHIESLNQIITFGPKW